MQCWLKSTFLLEPTLHRAVYPLKFCLSRFSLMDSPHLHLICTSMNGDVFFFFPQTIHSWLQHKLTLPHCLSNTILSLCPSHPLHSPPPFATSVLSLCIPSSSSFLLIPFSHFSLVLSSPLKVFFKNSSL